ncbi:MAG: response regulator transcription factor [Bacillota bacterium]|nr:response regulator transcription factor [Bacillota bacterium]
MENTAKIMIVDDEESVQNVVQSIMTKDGYQICFAADGEEALKVFSDEQPHLVILDIMLPEIDGFEVCRRIRETSSVPIIMLSAKGDIVDKTVGFTMGTDDYLAKPFSPVELSLRVKALLKRTAQSAGADKIEKVPDLMRIKDLEIYPKRYEVKMHGENVELTCKEFELLRFMASHQGQVFTRKQLFDTIWGEDYMGDTGNITVFIRKIREKVEKNPSKPEYILTVWGVGYKFVQ